jgi:hypothetical protein
MLACVSPSEVNMQESINTLQYAVRAKAVQNKVSANIHAAPPPNAAAEDGPDLLEESIVGVLKSQITKLKV